MDSGDNFDFFCIRILVICRDILYVWTLVICHDIFIIWTIQVYVFFFFNMYESMYVTIYDHNHHSIFEGGFQFSGFLSPRSCVPSPSETTSSSQPYRRFAFYLVSVYSSLSIDQASGIPLFQIFQHQCQSVSLQYKTMKRHTLEPVTQNHSYSINANCKYYWAI